LIPHLLFILNYISDLTSQTVSKMRLVSFLLNRRLPPGRIYAGKHRIIHKFGEENSNRLRNRFAIEEQNMFYLRHPFLSSEEASGFSKELGKHEKWMANVKSKVKPYRPNATLEDRLVAPLNTAKNWD